MVVSSANYAKKKTAKKNRVRKKMDDESYVKGEIIDEMYAIGHSIDNFCRGKEPRAYVLFTGNEKYMKFKQNVEYACDSLVTYTYIC